MREMVCSARGVRAAGGGVFAFTLTAALLVTAFAGAAQQPVAPQVPPPAAPQTPPPPPGTPAAPLPAPVLPPAPVVPVPQVLPINGPAGLVFHAIKADKAADFELVMLKFFDVLRRSTDPALTQLAAGWKLWRAAEAGPAGAVMFVFVIDPVVPGADYSGTFILTTLYAALPAEANELYRQFTEAYAGPRSVVTLGHVPTAPPAAAPATPKQP